MTHILASISAHGYGHMAITAPVLERLHEIEPEWEITISSALPERLLQSRIRCSFEATADATDFGLRMHQDLSVNSHATVSDYAAIHERWEHNVEQRAAWLTSSGFDLLVSNISYLNIAAARRADLPALAVSPLNWADLYHYYAPDTPACRIVFEQMVDAYNQAGAFLVPEPCMPMPHFDNVVVIPPVVQIGRDRREQLHRIFELDESSRLFLLALGGRESQLKTHDLPFIRGVSWLADERCGLRRQDILPLNDTGMMFPDLLASSDLLVCKPGYGAFAEAACLAKPVVYIRRPDWPEETYLIEWLNRQVPCREAVPHDARSLESCALDLLARSSANTCSPNGVDACIDRILGSVQSATHPGKAEGATGADPGFESR